MLHSGPWWCGGYRFTAPSRALLLGFCRPRSIERTSELRTKLANSEAHAGKFGPAQTLPGSKSCLGTAFQKTLAMRGAANTFSNLPGVPVPCLIGSTCQGLTASLGRPKLARNPGAGSRSHPSAVRWPSKAIPRKGAGHPAIHNRPVLTRMAGGCDRLGSAAGAAPALWVMNAWSQVQDFVLGSMSHGSPDGAGLFGATLGAYMSD